MAARADRFISSLVPIILGSALACNDPGGRDDAGDGPNIEDGDPLHGAELYQQMCAACHGLLGEGGVGPALAGWSRPADELISIIDETMPTQNPAVCTGTCPVDVAAYILSGFGGGCEGAPAGPRQLRLLTRREYNATIRDLLRLDQAGEPPAPGEPCTIDSDCVLTSESCVTDSCAADPCGRHTFVFDPAGQSYGAIHVAGSFNSWAATVAEGGWPLNFDAATGLWYGKFDLADGSHSYKFVLDESQWIPDPQNPNSEDDGFGGQNSLVDVSCPGGGGGGDGDFDFAAGFPVESRPQGYGYDNAAAAGLVTSVHVDQQLLAAGEVAALAVTRLDVLLPCDPSVDAQGCARDFVTSFGRRAFRRPLDAGEIDKYAGLILGQASFNEGIEVALRVMLTSPYFLYRFEIGSAQADGSARLSGYEIAAALSYGLWGTTPDDALLDAAAAGELDTVAGIEAQARRLLDDPRARELIATFASQWLGIESIAYADKSTVAFPEWQASLGQAMAEETRRFVTHVIFDGSGSYDELLTADYSFVNPALAAHYGIAGLDPGLGDQDFVEAGLPPERAGLLGQASLLASYAHSDQSSPVRRGLFVRQRLLCQQFGTPPPNAGGVPEVDANATTRERFGQHSADPNCSICHQYIDQLGFGFERFDAIGRWRYSENGQPIDASGDLNDVEGLGTGTSAPFDSLPALGGLLADSEAAHACYARQSFRFAMGKLESAQDLCALSDLEASFAASGYDVRELLIALVTSPMFINRR